MNKTLIWIAVGMLAGAMSLPAQVGRGGAPQAFGDKDKDGICDVTGQPVGQGRMAMMKGVAEGQGQFQGCYRRGGRGRMGRMGRVGRGMGQGMQQQQPQQEAPPAEDAK